MGFPPKMFTVLFALGRLPGWIAQWREMIHDPATKIGRPRQVYIGQPERHVPTQVYLPPDAQQRSTRLRRRASSSRPDAAINQRPAT